VPECLAWLLIGCARPTGNFVLATNLVLDRFILYGDSVDNTVENNASVFSLIRMRWLPSSRACGHEFVK